MSAITQRLLCVSSTLFAIAVFSGCAATPQAIDGAAQHQPAYVDEQIARYTPRAGHDRPLIAIIGDNDGTELSDFVIPFGVLSDAAVADVLTVSTEPGPIRSFTDLGKPGFKIMAQATLGEFDTSHPEGADYVIVPALHDTPNLISWIAAQAKKGATLVSICNGGMVVAETGVMQGRHATAHWSTESHRLEHHAEVRWTKNKRYVVDGNWISSAGVSAAIPTSLALVEAIAGYERAHVVAERLGVTEWSARHDSDAFQPQLFSTAWPLVKVNYTNRWFNSEDSYGIEAKPGIDEIALALTYDVYSSTGRSKAVLVAATTNPLKTRHGLTILPERSEDNTSDLRELVRLPGDQTPKRTLDETLDRIAERYGRTTAFGVALVFEYPDFKD